jgi:uroporphyrinogen decarboxylase
MKPKDRVLAALNHNETDRVPLDVAHDEIFPSLEAELRRHFMVKNMEAVRMALGLDVRWLQPISYRLSKHPELEALNWFGTPEDRLFSFGDGSGLGARPLQAVQTVAEIERFAWPDPNWFDYGSVTTLARQYRDYAIVAPGTWTPLFCRVSELCGMKETLMMLIDNPVLLDAMVERITDFYVQYLTRVLDAAPGQIDVMYTGDDPAGQQGMLFSLKLWRRFFKKPYERMFQVAQERGVRVMFHICGSAVHLIPDLVDSGVDILQVLQLTAKGMDPVKLKSEFGQDLCFWGGMDVQQLLPYGTPEEVRAEVRHLIDTLGKGGGYVLGSSHSLLDDVPLENVLAMYDEAQRYGNGRGIK